MNKSDVEVFTFKYSGYDEVKKKKKVVAAAMSHQEVVYAFFDFMEEVYGYELRSLYLKKEHR